MRKLLLNLFALLLLPPGIAAQAAPPKHAATPTIAHDSDGLPFVLELTELQKARLDAARQEIFRWQDKLQDALQRFSAVCTAAQKENKWPPVQCSLTDLTVTPQLPAAPEKK